MSVQPMPVGDDGAPNPVRVREGVLDDIISQAQAAAPLECCGLLLGTVNCVERVHRARNALASATRYLVDPVDHFAALREARALGLDVVGAYHSHPASLPLPSARDLDEAVPVEFLYVIVGPGPGGDVEVAAYRSAGGNFRAVELVRTT